MLFEELFLEKADQQKFQMFRVLKTTDATSLTINDISDRLHLSYQQAYNTFQDLLRDMQALDDSLNSTTGRQELLSQQTFKISLDQYRIFLLEQSLVFQFIDYLFQASNPTVADFCERHFVSKSTLLRKSTPVKHFMARYSLRFSYTHLKITGNEMNIRYFLFIVYWIGFHGIKWPLHDFSEAAIRDAYLEKNPEHQDFIVTLQQVLLLGIIRVRVSRGYLVQDSRAFDLITAKNSLFAQLTFPDHFLPTVSTAKQQVEKKFFFFAQASLITSAPDYNQREAKLLNYFKTQNNPLWQIALALLNHLAQTYQTSLQTDNNLVMVSLLRALMTTAIIQENYPKIIEFLQSDTEKYANSPICQVIADFFTIPQVRKKLPQLYRKRQALSQYLCYLLHPQLQQFEIQKTVKIWLVAENSDLLTSDLLYFLDRISIARILDQNASPADADLILTTIDAHAPLIKQLTQRRLPVLHWRLDAQESDYYSLYLKIKTIYAAK